MIYALSLLLFLSVLANVLAFIRRQLQDAELQDAFESLQSAHRENDLLRWSGDLARTAGRRDRRMRALGLIEGALS